MARFRMAVVMVVITGCMPVGTFRTARTLDPGTWEVAAGNGYVHRPTCWRSSGGSLPPIVFQCGYPQFVALARVGLLPWLDLGLRASVIGAEVEVGLGLKKGPFAVSLVPSVGVLAQASYGPFGAILGSGSFKTAAQVPLLLGIGLLPSNPRLLEITVGAIGRYELELSSPPQEALFAGASVGISTQVARHFFLRAEGVYLWRLYSSWSRSPLLNSNVMQVLLGCGVTFGSGRRE